LLGRNGKPSSVAPTYRWRDDYLSGTSFAGSLKRATIDPTIVESLALAPKRVYHAPPLPTEERCGRTLLRNEVGDNHLITLFTFLFLRVKLGEDSIVSVALSLGLRINVGHVSVR